MKRKILVLGSNSFSGSDFIDLLLENKDNKVLGISRSPEKSEIFLPYKLHTSNSFIFRQVNLNLEMGKLFKIIDRFSPEYIINFAAQSEVTPSWIYPEQWFETNVVSIAKLGNFLKDKKYLKRYIHISSPEVYGTCVGKVTESHPINPSTPYAASKAAGDLFLFTLFKNYNFPLIMIRSTNVYGAHQQLFKIIPRSIIYIKQGKIIKLHGGGKAIKSYIHIRDVSKGELIAMEKGKLGDIYHISPDGGASVRSVVRLICHKLGVSFTRVTKNAPERLGQDKAYIIDSTKIRGLIWKPTISLEQGVTGVINWINSYWNKIQYLPHEYIHKP